jgi:capsular polysaccharide biosynthesis protein
MDSAIPPGEIAADDRGRDLRAHYDAVAQNTLRLLWQRRRLLAKSIAAALVIAAATLVHMGPRYTTSALIRLDFDDGLPIANGTKPALIQVEAVGVLKSAADIIQSRAIADAVVEHLRLDKDSRFDRASLASRCLYVIRRLLGLQPTAATARDIAALNLMGRVQVFTGERSYVITINATAGDPQTATRLANAVAAEYWRQQTLQHLIATRAVARSILAQTALVYGPRVPDYQQAQTRVRQLEAQVRALRAAPEPNLVEVAAGRSLIPAQEVNQPSGPNVPVILLMAIILGFSVGAGLARYDIDLRLPQRWLLPLCGPEPLARLRVGGRELLARLRAGGRDLLARVRPYAVVPRMLRDTEQNPTRYFRRREDGREDSQIRRSETREEISFDS